MPKRECQPTPLSERHAAFEASLRDGGYGHDIYCWPFYANRDILAIYGLRHGADVPVDWLDRDSFVDRYVKACKVTLGVNLGHPRLGGVQVLKARIAELAMKWRTEALQAVGNSRRAA